MSFPKQTKDIIYKMLQEPTLDTFREFLHNQTGEHNSIDFKKQWIEKDSLAKEMLAIANSKGGIIVFGVSENADKSANPEGLDKIKDKADVSNEIKNYISSDLDYEIYDFSYTTAEYKALEGKHFQMMVIEDTPAYIPFLAKRESKSLKQNFVYVRRGTSCEIANEEELREIFNRRLNYMHPINGEPLKLPEHLTQLKALYDAIDKNTVHYEGGISSMLKVFTNNIISGKRITEPNPYYPEEEYDEFISRMILEKKKKIERVIDIY